MAPVALILIAFLLMASPATAQSLAFVDVTVIDVVDGAAEPGQTVIVTNDRIAAVGAADGMVIPTDATVIDGRGKFLIPGLWDFHLHNGERRLDARSLGADSNEVAHPVQGKWPTRSTRSGPGAGGLIGA